MSGRIYVKLWREKLKGGENEDKFLFYLNSWKLATFYSGLVPLL